jgi:hypothetical protein
MGRSPNMILVGLHLGLSIWMTSPFVYFLTAGAKTFTVPARDSGALLGQISFISGMACVLAPSNRQGIEHLKTSEREQHIDELCLDAAFSVLEIKSRESASEAVSGLAC